MKLLVSTWISLRKGTKLKLPFILDLGTEWSGAVVTVILRFWTEPLRQIVWFVLEEMQHLTRWCAINRTTAKQNGRSSSPTQSIRCTTLCPLNTPRISDQMTCSSTNIINSNKSFDQYSHLLRYSSTPLDTSATGRYSPPCSTYSPFLHSYDSLCYRLQSIYCN